ncbi:MAG: efflux RND transporter periplasmic adaptor subunit [Desulfococcaceae bacterium]|jgi:RND family efflux transporter MFP subunit|nr:efflux RND transporter periplasmic adaptor subunit [Desulfococcaceae bacterium]
MKDEYRDENNHKKESHRMRFALKTILPLLIISMGIAGAAWLKNSGTKPQKSAPPSLVSLVQVFPLSQSSETIVIEAMGTVLPAQQMLLKSRISGEVIEIHPEFTEGGLLKSGETVLRIDPLDYELKLARMQSQVSNAQYAMKMELGHQDVARREWQLLGKRKVSAQDKEMALRKPHLEKVKADLKAAQAELKQAELDLERTEIKVPFNAVVRSRQVEIGSQLAAQGQIAELVGTDEYWIQVSVPIERLHRITIPRRSSEKGSAARVIYSSGNYERTGSVVKLLSDLENSGRMARLLISVQDPLNLEKNAENSGTAPPPMLIGEYVRVAIQGREIPDVYRIPRTALRDNNTVWIEEEGKLRIRPVEIVWRDSDTVFLASGVENGENLIVSDIPAPIENMSLRVSTSGS